METPESARPEGAAPPATVLIVDDEVGIRELLRAWALTLGYQARTAVDGDRALETLRAERVDVIICDMNLPGIAGVALIEQLRREYPQIPIVIATGVRDVSASVTLREGVVGYLVKPFRREELAAMLKRALDPESPWRRSLRRPGDRGDLPDL